jgi:K+ transporter
MTAGLRRWTKISPRSLNTPSSLYVPDVNLKSWIKVRLRMDVALPLGTPSSVELAIAFSVAVGAFIVVVGAWSLRYCVSGMKRNVPNVPKI